LDFIGLTNFCIAVAGGGSASPFLRSSNLSLKSFTDSGSSDASFALDALLLTPLVDGLLEGPALRQFGVVTGLTSARPAEVEAPTISLITMSNSLEGE
jgi:hypothetical protein